MPSKAQVTGSRRRGRECALQALYLSDIIGHAAQQVPDAVLTGEPLPEKTLQFCRHLLAGIDSQRPSLDALIVKYAQNWELGRMAAIDRCILRLASFELLNDLETPVNVIINEAVEIAKKYSTAESGKFVNGILDKVKLERRAEMP